MSEPFWFSEPSILFRKDTWSRFVPTADMSVSAALNAVVRFAVYLGVLLTLTTADPSYVLFIPAVMTLTVFLNGWFPDARKMAEGFVSSYVGGERTQPTPDNPFMNPQLTDILDNPEKPPAAEVTAKDVRDKVNQAFAQTNNIFMDTSDVYDLVQSQRNFYTVPADDHAGLLKFLGKGAKSGKELSEGYVVAKGTYSDMTTPAPGQPTGTSGATSTSQF